MKTMMLALIALIAAQSSILAADTSGSLGPIEIKNINGPDSPQHFIMPIPIELQSKEKIEVRNVMVKVNFFDLVGGKHVATTADINSRWKKNPADWSKDGQETLEVELTRSQNTAADRQYFGYIVSVYYLNALQATHAEPATLAQEFPVSKNIELQAAK